MAHCHQHLQVGFRKIKTFDRILSERESMSENNTVKTSHNTDTSETGMLNSNFFMVLLTGTNIHPTNNCR